MAKENELTWPDFAIGLYERLTGRDAHIIYSFEDFTVQVPSKVGNDVEHAEWQVNGNLRIFTEEK